MSKIAYIDHSFHKKTVSTKFVPDLLSNRGHTVDFFWDDAWQGGRAVDFAEVLHYDAVIMFQSYATLRNEEFFKNLHHNITYIPMLDQFGVWRGPIFNLMAFWKPFQGCKVLNFSMAVHGMAVGMGIRSKLFRFYREPSVHIEERMGLHGFLWVRREDEVSWEVVKKLITTTLFDSFHLHVAKDPGSPEIKMPSIEDIAKYNITISTWFDDKKDFEQVLDKANVFFTPRMEEGIGQSFLEAFSRGQCVVAPNNGTMNEYIQDGFTGLLYDHENPKPLNFSNVKNICVNTHEACKAGYEQWLKSQDALVEYILMPNTIAYKYRYDYFSDYMHAPELDLKSEILKRLKLKFRNMPMVRSFYRKIKKIIK